MIPVTVAPLPAAGGWQQGRLRRVRAGGHRWYQRSCRHDKGQGASPPEPRVMAGRIGPLSHPGHPQPPIRVAGCE